MDELPVGAADEDLPAADEAPADEDFDALAPDALDALAGALPAADDAAPEEVGDVPADVVLPGLADVDDGRAPGVVAVAEGLGEVVGRGLVGGFGVLVGVGVAVAVGLGVGGAVGCTAGRAPAPKAKPIQLPAGADWVATPVEA
ncbi:hypothetical protein IEE94_02945 [Yimella sp. cx-573]|nr:hypothetical protein [Yimella sp. cx-573]